MKHVFTITLSILLLHNFSYAQIPVIDGINLPHNIMSGVSAYNAVQKSIEQLQTLQTELEYTIQNTLAPGFWIWDKAVNFEDNMKELQKKLDYFTKGGIEEYFKQYLSADFYRSSPCFKFGGCSQQEMARIKTSQRERLEAMRKTSTLTAEAVDKYLSATKQRGEMLRKLQYETKNSKGQMQSTQNTNQFLSIQTDLLQDINSNLFALQNQIRTITDEIYTSKSINDAAETQAQSRKFEKIRPLPSRYKYLKLR